MASIESPDIDSTDLFVRELRGLWEANGRPKLATLAAKSGVPRSTLGDAIAIRDRLPGEAAVRGLVQALDPDSTSTWLQRRTRLASDPGEGEQESVPIGAQAPEARKGLPALVWVLVGALVGAIAGSLVTWSILAPRLPVGDGADPADHQVCLETATTAAAAQKEGVGTLRLIYSASCHAYWAKITREDNSQLGNRVQVAVYEQDHKEHQQSAVEPDASSAYTLVLVRRDATARYCATGTVTVGDRSYPLGPVC